jgi:hypothetical protein
MDDDDGIVAPLNTRALILQRLAQVRYATIATVQQRE